MQSEVNTAELDPPHYDFVVVGAGPIGLACALTLQRAGYKTLVIDKGALVNSIVHYPTDLEFFSTPELLEIGGYPFPTRNYKPRRAEVIEYYRQVAFVEHVRFKLFERVEEVAGSVGAFTVRTDKSTYSCSRVIVATGFFDDPILLNIPGESLAKVSHYYTEPFKYSGQKVVVIGGANSAAKIALDLYRHGAEVTLVHRGPSLSKSVKYWIKPDLENRIKDGKIAARFDTSVSVIREDTVDLVGPDGTETIKNDWVLAMTGYLPDFRLLEYFGVSFKNDEHRTPMHDPKTMETNRKGLYLAGVVCGGRNTRVWFIENSRIHADLILAHAQSEN